MEKAALRDCIRTYTLTETKAPEGYVLGDVPWSESFTISKENSHVWFKDGQLNSEGSVQNDPHRLNVTKVSSDDGNKKLAHASFILRAADGRYVVLKGGSFSGWTTEESKATSLKRMRTARQRSNVFRLERIRSLKRFHLPDI
ncbi:prealbumin-like fold domain-containing protein [Clostridium sp. AM58-1XD]|uniref:MSCRAMM family protein n=1 Tax=Clostridium sp. AM58-1XD TaxID=2292307 RepID=UPI0015F3DDE0|nr:prealbumin-like fold domain-containing protein [Clostridium sp. AM58-1XD]